MTTPDIPEDIRAAARLTYEHLPLVHDGWDEDAVIDAISRALLRAREEAFEEAAKFCDERARAETEAAGFAEKAGIVDEVRARSYSSLIGHCLADEMRAEISAASIRTEGTKP